MITDTQAEADPPAIRERMIALLREAGPQRRLELACSLTATTRALAWSGIRKRHSGWTEDQCRIEYVRVLYGDVLASGFAGRLAQQSTVGDRKLVDF